MSDNDTDRLAFRNVLVISSDAELRRQISLLITRILANHRQYVHNPEEKGMPGANFSWNKIDLVLLHTEQPLDSYPGWYINVSSKKPINALIFISESEIENKLLFTSLGNVACLTREDLTQERLDDVIFRLLSPAQPEPETPPATPESTTPTPAPVTGVMRSLKASEIIESSREQNELDEPSRKFDVRQQDPTRNWTAFLRDEIRWPFSPEEVEDGTAIVGNYQLIDFLGTGGSSYVFEAIDRDSQAKYAVKLLDKTRTVDPKLEERFILEYQLLSKMNHRHIVSMIDHGEQQHLTYSVMELYSMGDLNSRIKHGMTDDKIILVISQVASALHYAHDRDILHRDLKPSNILFKTNSSVGLVDFGAARQLTGEDKHLTDEGQMVGTPLYLSPEQAMGDRLSPQSDLYSLGIILYQLIEGRVPFLGETAMDVMRAHVSSPVPLLSNDMSPFNDIIVHLLAKNPADRFASAGELIRALVTLDQGEVADYILEQIAE